MNISFHHILINQNQKAHSPPLGVLTLMKILQNKGQECSFNQFLHVKGELLDPEKLAQQVLEVPGVAAISTMINGLPLLIMALRLVKAQNPEKIIVVGGPGFTGIASAAIKHFPQIDIVCHGEGEKQIVKLVDYLNGKDDITSVPGICYRQNKSVHETPQAQRVKDLDLLPYLCFDDIRLSDYTGFPIMASRGCPYKCTFCDVAPSWGRRNTRRSIDHVLDELDFLYFEKGLRKISFVDDLFIINRKWVKEFCKKKIERENPMIWRANGHINLATDELISLMADAGCESIFYGVESGSDRVLKRIKKGFSFEKAVEILKLSLRYMNTNLNLIWGYPFETKEDLFATLRAHDLFNHKGLGCSLVMLAPLQSAPITNEFKDLHLNFSYPNIFLQDYYELKSSYGNEFEILIKQHPKIFSAFYSFSSENLHEHVNIVKSYQYNRNHQIVTPRELWQGV